MQSPLSAKKPLPYLFGRFENPERVASLRAELSDRDLDRVRAAAASRQGLVNSLLVLAVLYAARQTGVLAVATGVLGAVLGELGRSVWTTLVAGLAVLCAFNVLVATYDAAVYRVRWTAGASPPKVPRKAAVKTPGPATPPKAAASAVAPQPSASKAVAAAVAAATTPLRTGLRTSPGAPTTLPRTTPFRGPDEAPGALSTIAGTPIRFPHLWMDAPRGRLAGSSMELTRRFERAQAQLQERPKRGASDAAPASGLSDAAGLAVSQALAKPGVSATSALRSGARGSGRESTEHVPFSTLASTLALDATLPFWIEQTRTWLNDTILRPLVASMDRVDQALADAQLQTLGVEQATLDNLNAAHVFARGSAAPLAPAAGHKPRSLLELFQSPLQSTPLAQERYRIELYLQLPGQPLFLSLLARRYIVARLRFLARSRRLAHFEANGGFSVFEGLAWNVERFPTDSQLVMHLFCTFMDVTLTSFGGSYYGGLDREQPFTSRYVCDAGARDVGPTADRQATTGDSGVAANVAAAGAALGAAEALVASAPAIAAPPAASSQGSWAERIDAALRKSLQTSMANQFLFGRSPAAGTMGTPRASSLRTGPDMPPPTTSTTAAAPMSSTLVDARSNTSSGPTQTAAAALGPSVAGRRGPQPPQPVVIKRYRAVPAHHTLLVDRGRQEWMLDVNRNNVFCAIALFAWYIRDREAGYLDNFDILSRPVDFEAIFASGDLRSAEVSGELSRPRRFAGVRASDLLASAVSLDAPLVRPAGAC